MPAGLDWLWISKKNRNDIAIELYGAALWAAPVFVIQVYHPIFCRGRCPHRSARPGSLIAVGRDDSARRQPSPWGADSPYQGADSPCQGEMAEGQRG